MSANFSDRQLPFSAYSTLNCRRPARSVTGRENASAWASVCIPAFSIMAFMMGFRVSAEARIKISSFSDASDTPKNFFASSVPVPFAWTYISNISRIFAASSGFTTSFFVLIPSILIGSVWKP